jgi:hypothetical protein
VFHVLLHGTLVNHPTPTRNRAPRPPRRGVCVCARSLFVGGGGGGEARRVNLASDVGTNTRTNPRRQCEQWNAAPEERAPLLMRAGGRVFPAAGDCLRHARARSIYAMPLLQLQCQCPAAAAGTGFQTLPHRAGQSIGALGRAGAWSSAPSNSGTRDPRAIARRARTRIPAKTKPR